VYLTQGSTANFKNEKTFSEPWVAGMGVSGSLGGGQELSGFRDWESAAGKKRCTGNGV